MLGHRDWYSGLKRFSSVLVAIVICVTIVLQTSAFAETPSALTDNTVTVSPFLSDVRVDPTETAKEVPFYLSNRSNETKNFNVSTVNFGSLNDTGGLAFSGSDTKLFTEKYGLAKWLTLTPSRVSVPPGKTAKVVATIQNDATLGPGGHYAAIIMTLDHAATKDNVMVEQKISALIFATKVGGEVYDMRLKSARHDGSWLQVPSVYTLGFQNTGNVQIVPRGTIRLNDPRGTEVYRSTINDASSYVLPETSRQLVVQTGAQEHAAWLPGKYKITVDYRYDGRAEFASKTYYFTYWNTPGIITASIGLGVVAYGIFILIRRRQKQQ